MFKKIAFTLLLSFSSVQAAPLLEPVREQAAPVSYKKSMRQYALFTPKENLKLPQWALFKRLFQSYRRKTFSKNVKPTIPRLIHFIWIGGPIPEWDQKMIDSWKKFHPEPEWKVILWTEKDLPAFQLKHQAAYDAATRLQQKSNIFRYEILERLGGLYVDTDIECLKSVDPIHMSCEFYACLEYNKDPVLCNALIGCVAHHPIMQRVCDLIGTEYPGPRYFTKCVTSIIQSDPMAAKGKIVPFPVTYFYPISWDFETPPTPDDLEKLKLQYAKPESYAIHYWANAWRKKP